MKSYYLFETIIDTPHIKRQFYLPVWIKRVTGVLFFPVVPIPKVPDGSILGVAALSIENEKINIATNIKVFKKAPCFYVGKDATDAEGESFLDKGYCANLDFYGCNDAVSPNSYVLFKYTNSKIIKTLTEFELIQMTMQKLQSIIGKKVKFQDFEGYLHSVSINYSNNRINFRIYGTVEWGDKYYQFSVSEMTNEIYTFLDPATEYRPFFEKIEENFDEPYKLKIVLRHEIE